MNQPKSSLTGLSNGTIKSNGIQKKWTEIVLILWEFAHFSPMEKISIESMEICSVISNGEILHCVNEILVIVAKTLADSLSYCTLNNFDGFYRGK